MKTKTNLLAVGMLLAVLARGAQPVITTQPQWTTNVAGTTATLSVEATGTPPLSYQWHKNSSPLTGQTNAMLVLTNVQKGDQAPYSVVITNGEGAVTSVVARLYVLVPPSITKEPVDVLADVGTNASFTVVATGTTPLFYQWLFNNSALPTKTNFSLTLVGVQPTNAGPYSVVVTNVAGAATSRVATLELCPCPPRITVPPTNQSAEVGDIVTFRALAAGTAPLMYQWRFNDEALPGKTNTNLYLRNVQLTNPGAYTVVVTNLYGSATSQVATLTVVPVTFTRTSGTNILLVIADDYGTDSLSLYNTNASASLPPTPNINSLYDSG
ncbi:MAG TPA: immunoglobulin domain-containing protein, partial [Verrucomicrobiae bacterium]|nr:immunoglobulin domain-containing protein [Verrucomicrobiae bacterium]